MTISGFVDSRFAPVEGLFGEVIDSQARGGAAFSAFVEGQCVIDLFGGESRPGVPWTDDTVSVIFSCTKGLVAVLVGQMVEQGLCDPDSPVSRYWPEFSVVSPTLTVRQLLEHRAGLSATRASMSLDDVLAGGPVLDALLSQQPLWELGTGYAYHAITFGHLVGELIRRITGETAGAVFQQAVAQPLGVRAWIGLPESEEPRVAELCAASDFTRPATADESPEYWDERAMTFGNAFPLGDIGKQDRGFNLPKVHQAELPGANGITSAHALAKIWSSVVTETDGVRVLTDDTVAMMTERRVSGPSVWQDPGPWWDRGFGVMLATHGKPELLSPHSFGHDGLGGQAGWTDPTHKASIGFVTNHLVSGADEHRRWTTLVAEVRRILEND
jgi:CubicO group peptidase (beta-lactamase class C family)